MTVIFPLNLFVCLVWVAISMLLFFAIIRLLRSKRSKPCLEAFDKIGTPLMDWFEKQIESLLYRFSNKTLPQRTQLCIGIAALTPVWIILTELLFN
jgi:hypothetical protein